MGLWTNSELHGECDWNERGFHTLIPGRSLAREPPYWSYSMYSFLPRHLSLTSVRALTLAFCVSFVVVACGGGKSGAPSGGSYMAFALPEN